MNILIFTGKLGPEELFDKTSYSYGKPCHFCHLYFIFKFCTCVQLQNVNPTNSIYTKPAHHSSFFIPKIMMAIWNCRRKTTVESWHTIPRKFLEILSVIHRKCQLVNSELQQLLRFLPWPWFLLNSQILSLLPSTQPCAKQGHETWPIKSDTPQSCLIQIKLNLLGEPDCFPAETNVVWSLMFLQQWTLISKALKTSFCFPSFASV